MTNEKTVYDCIRIKSMVGSSGVIKKTARLKK